MTTPEISADSATVQIVTRVESTGTDKVSVGTAIYELDVTGRKSAKPVAQLAAKEADAVTSVGEQTSRLKVANPKLWSCEKPQRYVAVTTLMQAGNCREYSESSGFGVRFGPDTP